MRYGMNLLLWTDELTEAALPTLERLKTIGYDNVEIPIMKGDPDDFYRWSKKLDELGLERSVVTVRTADDNPISRDRNTRELGVARTKQALDCCEAIGAKLLAGPFHSALGVFSGRGPTAEEWSYGVESMQRVAEYAERRGITLGLEYLNRFECYFLNSAEDTARFVEVVDNPRCQMIYDTFHAHIEEKSVEDSLLRSQKHLVHVHVSENDRGTPGEGQVRWEETFRSLIEMQYEGVLMVEAFGLALPSLAAATKIWRRMYRDEFQLAKDALAFMRYQWEDNLAHGRRSRFSKLSANYSGLGT
ncbi:MAG: sugar phosphate isomerase/epimerase family protein [Bdellovibrionota bacterium]